MTSRPAGQAVSGAPPSDAELLSEVAAGKLSALGRLYDRHHQPVYRFCARMTGSDADADDITHQTFLTVARIAGTYDGRASVRAWVLGVAARYLADQRRASARLRRFLGRLLAEQEPARDLRAAAEARLELGAVARALDEMPFEKRAALLLFEVEGLSGEEIGGGALGVPVGTVWTRLHAARKELSRVLPRHEDDDEEVTR